ncbi:uncharacterized protein LOC118179531 [Stegodyphus dumicola]|uniref:uncharacterized protein LOC118179531 n=1 Tax=Stegodyphus dumicola TaxID=202533 RepID=UPI0015ADDDA1|nr:uncharacterized protein LOC118179531 [Stegodyphus dumicola]
MDYAGALILRNGQKAWIVIFTCASYRAVHLELTIPLSTNHFLKTLSRFIARGGLPSIFYCDNGSNFSRAENLLKKIETSFSNAVYIKRSFGNLIPHLHPWWDEWWERLIGIIKGILRKVLGRSSLNLEEMDTVICDIEGVINQRPLTYISEDVDDF